MRELRAQQGLEPTRVVKRRFETAPGREMQIDWSPYSVSIAGAMIKVPALGCLLCASRKLYLRLFRNERQSTLLEALASAFEYFEGVAARLVLDNMATAVLGRHGSERKVLWHPRFLDFARHYGFEPFASKPGDPDRKGKKEKTFRLVYDDFIKGTDFASWDDLDVRRRIWLDETAGVGNLRVHGTTRRVVNEAWLEEKPFLIQLPDKRFAVVTVEGLDGFNFALRPQLDPRVVKELLNARYAEERRNVLCLGKPGLGKTRVAKAIVHAACLAGYSTLCVLTVDMLEDLHASAADHSFARALRRYIKPQVLLLDEFGHAGPFDALASHHLFRVVGARHQHGSIVITANTGFSKWKNLFPSEETAVATVDRLVDRATILRFTGKTMRDPLLISGAPLDD